MNLNLLFNRGLITFDACFRRFIKSKETPETQKNVLIVFQQAFGDAVIIQNSLQSYTNAFPQAEGYKVKILVKPSVLRFMRANLVLPEDIEYEEVDFKKFLEDYKYYRSTVKKYKNSASTLIVPGTSLSAEIFSTANNAPRRVGLMRSHEVTHPYIYAMFYRLAYTEKVVPEKDEMMLQRHRDLMNYLGDKGFKAKLPEPVKHEKVIAEDKYAVLCPGSSKMEKCWPIDRFARVADYIIESYDMNVHLCGGADERHFADELMKFVKNKDRVISHVGNTSFADWSAIIQYADLVVGNDSATVHLAAAHRCRAICIAGVYDKFQFFPYKVDELNEGDRLPMTILKDKTCEYCRTVGYDAGYGNPACANKIKNNECALCIDEISVKDVMGQISKAIKEQIK